MDALDKLLKNQMKILDKLKKISEQLPKTRTGVQDLSPQQVRGVVLRAGLSDFSVALKGTLDKAQGASKALPGQASFSTIPKASPKAMKGILANAQFNIEANVGTALTSAIKGAIEGNVRGGENLEIFNARIAQAVDKSVGQIRTLTNTALSEVVRAVEAERGKRIPPHERLWLVGGPRDNANRNFCHFLVGKAIPEFLLDKLNNNQGVPVRSTFGGFNCRHTLTPISAAFVKFRKIEVVTPAVVAKANALARQKPRNK